MSFCESRESHQILLDVKERNPQIYLKPQSHARPQVCNSAPVISSIPLTRLRSPARMAEFLDNLWGVDRDEFPVQPNSNTSRNLGSQNYIPEPFRGS